MIFKDIVICTTKEAAPFSTLRSTRPKAMYAIMSETLTMPTKVSYSAFFTTTLPMWCLAMTWRASNADVSVLM